jgi:hypothetical protein
VVTSITVKILAEDEISVIELDWAWLDGALGVTSLEDGLAAEEEGIMTDDELDKTSFDETLKIPLDGELIALDGVITGNELDETAFGNTFEEESRDRGKLVVVESEKSVDEMIELTKGYDTVDDEGTTEETEH